MAKGNMFLGMSRGSVGDVTFYRGRGQQLARARNRAPKNPRSSAQIIQRMILATTSKAYSRMKSIVDHSFQGVTYGGESQSYFLKRNMERIRNYVAASLDMYPASISNPLEYVGLSMPTDAHESGIGLLISQGTIPSIPVSLTTPASEDDSPEVDYFGSIIPSSGSVPTVKKVMTALGAVRGDQITVVGLHGNVFSASRYVIKLDASDDDLEMDWEPNIAAFDLDKSIFGDMYINFKAGGANQIKLTVSSNISGLNAAAIILSRKVNDVWERSTQYLVPLGEVGQNVQAIIDLWSLGTVPVGVDSPYYLNNADD